MDFIEGVMEDTRNSNEIKKIVEDESMDKTFHSQPTTNVELAPFDLKTRRMGNSSVVKLIFSAEALALNQSSQKKTYLQ